eukprot:GHVT01102498.1.p1 GENE.GHVT01102498.1~~GHVT01102498.1.p1  ORF type:complete len:464 (-),score=75.03 GHVT01102498.1:135-1526(-)
MNFRLVALALSFLAPIGGSTPIASTLAHLSPPPGPTALVRHGAAPDRKSAKREAPSAVGVDFPSGAFERRRRAKALPRELRAAPSCDNSPIESPDEHTAPLEKLTNSNRIVSAYKANIPLRDGRMDNHTFFRKSSNLFYSLNNTPCDDSFSFSNFWSCSSLSVPSASSTLLRSAASSPAAPSLFSSIPSASLSPHRRLSLSGSARSLSSPPLKFFSLPAGRTLAWAGVPPPLHKRLGRRANTRNRNRRRQAPPPPRAISFLGKFIQKTRQVPPVTRAYVFVAIGLTLLLHSGVPPEQYALHFGRLFLSLELWRLMTGSCFFGPASLSSCLSLFLFFETSRGLEQSIGSSQYLRFLGSQIAALSACCLFLKIPFCSSAVCAAVNYRAARLGRKEEVTKTLFGIQTKKHLIPFISIAVDVLHAQTLKAALPGCLGILTAHTYYFLTQIFPRMQQEEVETAADEGR